MNIIIIPGFMGYPEEITFQELGKTLNEMGHSVNKIAWPHFFPDELNEYNFTSMIAHSRDVIKSLNKDNLIILGFSMGGVIATL